MVHGLSTNTYIIVFLSTLSICIGNGAFLRGSGCTGEDCPVPCSPHCRATCDDTGACPGGCLAGWHGPNCDKSCPEYQYGVNCQRSCGHCEDDAVCDPATGQCPLDCVPGFTGQLCNQHCDPYFYGKGCHYQCHKCRNDKPCNIVTGYCINGCAPGWTGDLCDQVCVNATFGIDCLGSCGHCNNNETCEHVTGHCTSGCAAGWTGERCSTPCSRDWYGEECDFRCGNCREGPCHTQTGICSRGCQAGWMGERCQTPCEEGRYGEDCLEECGHCQQETCDRTAGICGRGCKPGWQGLFCTTNQTDGVELAEPVPDVRKEVKKQPTVSLLAVVIVLLFIALSSTVVYFVCIRPKRMSLAASLHSRLSSVRSTQDAEPHVYEQVATCGPWEITKANLVLTSEKLGHGQFGQVRKGYLKNIRSHNIPVAVKSLKVSSSEKDKTDFMNELMILKKVGHHANVVCLIGSCNISGTLYVAMEYCPHGDLRTHLRNSRKSRQRVYSNVQSAPPMAYSSLLQFALDVAAGMAHLADRQIIHRDLAARNVLLDENNVAKVADFGLSKNDDTYVKTSKSKVPVRWLALESIYENIYTTQSDIWSFGVFLWEIVTFGGTPYHGMDTQQFCNLLKQGYRLCRPRHCDLNLYSMMLQCWQEDPQQRPDFSDLQSRLQCMVDDIQIYINIDEDMTYTNMNSQS